MSNFAGTGALLVWMARRDRVWLTVWVLAISIGTALMAPYFTDTYPSAESRALMAQTMSSPAMVLLFGPVYSPENYHNGALLANFMLLFSAAVVAAMNVLLIIRHTRSDEEFGRLELLRSLPVGRLATTTAALILAAGANFAIGVITGLGIAVFRIADISFGGSILFGAALAGVGVCCAALTAVCAQLNANARTSIGIAFALVGASYLLRGVGDTGIRVLSVTSPFGLAHLAQPYVENYWWPIGVLFAMALGLSCAALGLNSRRDLGAGLFAARPGPTQASRLLGSPLGLAVRLVRGSVVAWIATMVVLAVTFGSVFADLEALVGDSEFLQTYFEASEFTIVEEFLALMVALIALIAAIPTLSALVRLRSEEKAGHAEQILARSTTRHSLFGAFAWPALVQPVILIAVGSLTLWAVAAATATDVPTWSRCLGAAVSYLPAVWVVVGIAACLIGWFPRFVTGSYLYLGYCFAVLIGVMMFGLPSELGWISAFDAIPRVLVEPISYREPVALLIGAGALIGLGFVGFRRRDIVCV